jgi:hypothetical protein
VISFVDAINHGDVDRLAALMAPDRPGATSWDSPRDV